MNEVLYCYQCGKHVKRDGEKCWYCSAPTRRTIRPPRHCPFCDEVIGFKAIKCPHCGEFLDENKRPVVQQPPNQIIYVIDKAVIQGEQPLTLSGGSPVPPNVARRLSHQTLKAIRTNDPRLIDQTGVRALPAPEYAISAADDDRIIDITPSQGTGSRAVSEQRQLVKAKTKPSSIEEKQNKLIRRGETNDVVPVEEQTLAGAITRVIFKTTGTAIAKMGQFAYDALTEKPPKKETAKPPTEEDRYRICKLCATETLATDNYCFHCGVLMTERAASQKVEFYEPGGPSSAGLFFVSFLLIAAFVTLSLMPVLKAFQEGPVAYLAPGMAGLALTLIIIAFFRRRTSGNQIITIVFFLLWLASVLYVFLG